MKLSVLVFTAVLLLWPMPSLTQDSVSVESLTVGETVTFRSAVLDETRTVNVYLPDGYSDSTPKTYPVIYLLDGSRDEDFIHVVGIVQFGSFSWIRMIPETIVVGIANVDRQRDFTFPTRVEKDQTDIPTAGGSAKFIEFLEEELQPLIAGRYRTSSERTLIGQSLGGLLATEILFKKPELFDNFIIVSPSLWWDDESLLKAVPTRYDSRKSVYVAVGKEGPVMERLARRLHGRLKAAGSQGNRLYFKFLKQRDHGDTLHLAVYDGFEKIFGRKGS